MTDALAASVQAALSLEGVGQAILPGYAGVMPVQSWGETSFSCNPGRAVARGAYFCTLKDHDGEDDRASALDRPGNPRRPTETAGFLGCGLLDRVGLFR